MPAPSGIRLGLTNVKKLLQSLGSPHKAGWKVIHVAGTNGKGSVCAYLSSSLKSGHIKTGRFTSPHLLDRWDCITIDGKTIEESLFTETERLVIETDLRESIGCSSFEILTAVAFEIFRKTNVQIAVVEVGVGGRTDATNVFEKEQLLVSVITNIGLDHEALLGNTIEEIARAKGGIIKEGTPCIVDGENSPNVIKVLQEESDRVGAQLIVTQYDSKSSILNTEAFGNLSLGYSPSDDIWTRLPGKHQLFNMATAITVLSIVANMKQYKSKITLPVVREGISNTEWAGRLQWIEVNGRKVLLDGAHNKQAAAFLSDYVESTRNGRSVTWIMAMSAGKAAKDIFGELFLSKRRKQNFLVAVEFGRVDGMPWVKPCSKEQLEDVAKSFLPPDQVTGDDAVLDAVKTKPPKDHLVVVCGSLYLVSTLLRDMAKQS